MVSMKIKTQLFLMLFIYNNITTAENITQRENVIQNHNHNEETKENHTHNEETKEKKNLNIKLEDDTDTTNFQNITLENENQSLLKNGMNNINKSISSTTASVSSSTASISSTTTTAAAASRLAGGVVEWKENSNTTAARKSKILPFFSDVIASSNPLKEINEGMGNFIDLDLNQLSIENLQKLNTFTRISEYASFFGLDIFEEDSENIYVNSSNGTQIRDEGSASFTRTSSLGRADRTIGAYNSDNDIVSGVFASCQPELQTVVLDEPLGTMYLPGCVRLRRCGGCCVGNLLECRPTKTDPVKIKVLKVAQKSSKSATSQSTSILGRGRGHARGRGRVPRSSRRPQSRKRAMLHIVNEWQHTACACQCRVQPHHCHPDLQDYSHNECICVCKNRSEEKLCYTRSSSHFWERSSCSCKCKRTLKCSTGEFFNVDSCRCSKALEEISP